MSAVAERVQTHTATDGDTARKVRVMTLPGAATTVARPHHLFRVTPQRRRAATVNP
jgi:hypothetical protein